jgi:6-phosphogluconolactonase
MMMKLVRNADEGVQLAFDAIRQKLLTGRRLNLALSGGSTPLPLYRQLSNFVETDLGLASKLNVCWVDERIVPYESERSNFGNALKEWPSLRKEVNAIPVPTHLALEEIPASYTASIGEAGFYVDGNFTIDIAILGMGSDGHTASIFPGLEFSIENEILGMSYNADFKEWRASLKSGALNSSELKIALVFGEDKRENLNACLSKSKDLPFASVIDDKLMIITDLDVNTH